MIQFNLLPDIKVEYLKSRRQKYLVVLACIVAAIAAVAVLIFMLMLVHAVQKKNLSDLNKDIASASTELKNTQDINKILTVQGQLKTLPGLHDQKPVASRLFGYISQITPTGTSINNLSVDFAKNTMTITGTANELKTINVYTNTLKATTFAVKDSTATSNAFSDVVLGTFGRGETEANYVINLTFDPLIFNSKNEITLNVPDSAAVRAAGDTSTLFTGGTR